MQKRRSWQRWSVTSELESTSAERWQPRWPGGLWGGRARPRSAAGHFNPPGRGDLHRPRRPCRKATRHTLPVPHQPTRGIWDFGVPFPQKSANSSLGFKYLGEIRVLCSSQTALQGSGFQNTVIFTASLTSKTFMVANQCCYSPFGRRGFQDVEMCVAIPGSKWLQLPRLLKRLP